MLVNHDQNVLVLFRLAQSMWLYVKLESSSCRIYYVNLFGSIDRSKVVQVIFFYRIFNSAQAYLSCKVLCFVLSIKGKTLATFWLGFLCCVCESFVGSRGGCLYIYLGFPRFEIMSRTWWSIQLQIQELKDIQVGVFVLAGNPRKK